MRDLLVTAIVFGAIPFIFKRPWIGILLWSWLGYMNPHRLTWGFASTFPFAFIVAIVVVIAFVVSREKKEMVWTRETVVLLLFIGWMLFTTFFALYPELAWAQWNKVWKIQLMVFLTVMLIQNRQQLHWLVWVISASIGYYGVKGGIFTIMTGGNFRVWGPEGTFIGGNNEIGLALIITIPLMRYLHLQAENKWVRWGLAAAMVLSAIAAIGTQSRGALVAILAMGFFLWLKSRQKAVTAIYVVIAVAVLATLMPQSWYDRMDTIANYQEDGSAQGRINAWHTAFNLAKHRITGGGFEPFQAAVFRQYAPNPLDFRDVHSIYFEAMGEHGFIGFGLFMMFGLLGWLRAQQVIKRCKLDPDKKWASDLAAMIQVSLVGYAVGGAFLGLAYFDLPYHLIIIIVLAAKFTGLLGDVRQAKGIGAEAATIHPSARWANPSAWKRR